MSVEEMSSSPNHQPDPDPSGGWGTGALGTRPGNPSDDEPDPPDLADLSDAAANRVRRFLAESVINGGASPADVADLYTAPEIVADERATSYLDRRYVQGQVPSDWRDLQDDLTTAHFGSPPGSSAGQLLARVEESRGVTRPPRSIFDDPDLDDDVDDRAPRLADRDPTLADLDDDGRQVIERHVVAEVMAYGVPPARTMELRAWLHAAGDERSLQYLDLPYDRGERPADWDELRDRALRLRAVLEARGQDPTEVFTQAQAANPHLDAPDLLTLLEEQAS
jgi:hypothetical protein